VSSARVGQGFDAHRFGAGRGLVLCGVAIEDAPALDGHSDADVALHAVADALLGSIADGDLGEHFPSADPRWRGTPSTIFVDEAVARVREAGFRLSSCDLTIIGERPRIALHREAMRRRLAELLGADRGAVSIKATTTDGLGFTGRGDGLAAMAVVLVERGTDDA
jgi:2-C-methyl-D-erythritol 4-phosphate cytidylyltransferase/2-C-methyl-D-erythritol 2,4-cyclodiphosphate synthase